MTQSAGIVGAGIMGRLLALALRREGWDVTLFDRDTEEGTLGCTWTGAGMIAPYCELEAAEQLITALGVQSMDLWPAWMKHLAEPVYYQGGGSLVVAHPHDRLELERLRRRVTDNAPRPDIMREIDVDGIRELEPQLAEQFSSGLYFPFEQHMDNRGLVRAMGKTLHRDGIRWITGVEIHGVKAGRVEGPESWSFEWVFDCRGIGARNELPTLRGVRGELLYLHAPEVHFSRPVRIMHPRQSIYIVPRPDQVYVVGATAIESEDVREITVRSSLELLSAAYTVHTGFAEARLIETSVSARPALPDNLPRFFVRDGLARINGLYRHGFLIAPALTELMLSYLKEGNVPETAKEIFEEENAESA